MGLALVGAAESLSRWWLEHPDLPREAVARLAMNFAWLGLGRLVRGEGWSPPAAVRSQRSLIEAGQGNATGSR